MNFGSKLPLLPVDVVLFPRMQLPLRITDKQLCRMIVRSWEYNEPFGVALTRSKNADMDEPYLVGTTAIIKALHEESDNQLEVLLEGEERFRIRKIDNCFKPYLISTVDPLYETPLPRTPKARRLLRKAWEVFSNYLELTLGFDHIKLKIINPSDAYMLSISMAMMVDISPLQKQKLLEITDTVERFEEIIPAIERLNNTLKQSHIAPLDIKLYKENWIEPN